VRILLTGGTGFIGSALARALRQRRDEVVIVSRGATGDVSWDGVPAQVEHADAVVHLAGESIAGGRWTRARMQRIRASRADTTAQIADAIARADRRPRVLVSASAIGIYGMRRDDQVLDEEEPPAGDDLARICVAWEGAADPVRAVGVRVVHPRIGMVLGRGGGALAQLELLFKSFVGGPLGDGQQWVSWVHQKDLVRVLLSAIDQDGLSGPVNVVAPEPVRMNEFAQTLGHALGRPAVLRAPGFALRLALGKGLAELLLTGQRIEPRKLQAMGYRFEFARLDQALADLYGDPEAAR
jgi:uncharacterized protein (TIGR01777 family)